MIGRIGNLVIPRNRLEEVQELNGHQQDEAAFSLFGLSVGPLVQGKPVGQTWYKTSVYTVSLIRPWMMIPRSEKHF